jgi:hypothetical protein
MKTSGARRLVVITSVGTGETVDNVPMIFKFVRWAFLQAAFRDKNAQEALVRESGLDWTIVRPGGLTNAPATGRVAIDATNKVMATFITRADVAATVLRLAGSAEYTQQAICINNEP